ncbi:glycosyltransferase family 39 protein [Streptomyces sp. NPDC057694]|uniref:glycosyltransferase family 39 protein n=1 Tax=Streptomyces sp. NPDC057694 TaxID=3346216 RepID=UPI0036BFECFB
MLRTGEATELQGGLRGGPVPARRWRGGNPPGVLRALAVFAAVRAVGVVLVVLTDLSGGHSATRTLTRAWDAVWYLHIAEHGYGTREYLSSFGTVQTDWAFFPLFPLLTRWADVVLPGGVGPAALLVAWAAALAAAWGVYAVGHRLYGTATATFLVVLWALLPQAVVLTLAYSESLFAALAAWALYALLSRNWPLAGVLAALAGLTRPTGVAVAAAVVVTAGWELVRRRGRGRGPWLAVLLAPAGWLGYVLWVGARTGDLLHGYFTVQDAWKSGLDFGASSLRFLRVLFLYGGKVVYPVSVLLVAAAVVLFCLLCLERSPRAALPLLVFSGMLVLMVLLLGGPFASKPRFVLPAFPLLIPVARTMARGWPRRRAQVLVVTGAVACAGLSYGAWVAAAVKTPL